MDTNPTPQEIQSGRFAAICSYLSILLLVPILFARQNRYAMYHANQGLILLLFTCCIYVVRRLPLIGLIGGPLEVVAFIFLVLGVVNAAMGKTSPLPLIGGLSLLKF